MVDSAPFHPIRPGARLYVAGYRGLVGGAIARRARARGVDVIGHTHAELDLTDRAATLHALRQARPSHLVLAAARVGGIMANATQPVEFLEENLRIQLSVISAAYEAGVPRLLFLGSSCIYPKLAAQPISEDALLTGPLEPTNEAYAIAKIAGVKQIQAYRREYGAHFISAMPTNVYGPGDNFDLATSHVLPALIRRFHEATVAGAAEVTLWGTGTPLREFIHADDLADACLTILDSYDEDEPINVGQHVTATGPPRLEGPLAGDQLPMPAKQRIRRDDGCDLPQDPPAQTMSSGGQSSPVVIGQPQASGTELAAKQAILFHQVGENLSFASVEPTGEDEQQKLEGRDVDHSPSLFRANRRRLSDGTVRALQQDSLLVSSCSFIRRLAGRDRIFKRGRAQRILASSNRALRQRARWQEARMR